MSEDTLTDEAGIAAAAAADVTLTHPGRVVFKDDGITKARMVAYYAAVAERMLAHVGDRPLSLLRGPQGAAGHKFFQKHDGGGFPDAMMTTEIDEKDGSGTAKHFYIDDVAGLIGGTQMNVLEWHVWGSRRDLVEKAERMVFDLDPDEGLGFAQVRTSAINIRDALAAIGLASYPMLTGGKGIHVIAPLLRRTEWPEIKAFCRGFAKRLATEQPDRFTSVLSKEKRRGKLFIDYLRNERGSTAVAPWSIRAREGAPCAVPVSWDELATFDRANLFGMEAAAERARGPEPWPDYFALTQSISPAMLAAVAG